MAIHIVAPTKKSVNCSSGSSSLIRGWSRIHPVNGAQFPAAIIKLCVKVLVNLLLVHYTAILASSQLTDLLFQPVNLGHQVWAHLIDASPISVTSGTFLVSISAITHDCVTSTCLSPPYNFTQFGCTPFGFNIFSAP